MLNVGGVSKLLQREGSILLSCLGFTAFAYVFILVNIFAFTLLFPFSPF